MSESANLLKLFRVDQQIRGLRSRLTSAERFLAEQKRLMDELNAKLNIATNQFKIAKTAAAGAEGEAARIEARMNHLREQMNLAKTNKEYSAFLTEVNSLKVLKDEQDRLQLEQLDRVDQLSKQMTDLDSLVKDRRGVATKAQIERDGKEGEIKDRLGELTKERNTVRGGVEASHAKRLEDLMERLGEDSMAQVEEIDRRNHEWSCGACRMAVPAQVLSIITRGALVNCPSCGAFLYTETDVASKKLPKAKKGETLEA